MLKYYLDKTGKVIKSILFPSSEFVDTEPREGSLNPVTSGGVAGSVAQQSSNIAPNYTKKTYEANSYVMRDGVLYTNPNAIGTAEDWNPAHWTLANIGDMINTAKKWTEKSVSYNLTGGKTENLDVQDHEFVKIELRRKASGTCYLNIHLYGECYVYLNKGISSVARTFVGASTSITTTDINTGIAKLNSGGTAVEFDKPSPSDTTSNLLLLHYYGEGTLVITPIP